MPRGIKATRVTDGAVSNYKTNSVKPPSTAKSSAKNIKRPGQPGK